MMKFFILFCVVVTIGVTAGKNYCDLPCWDYKTKTMIENIGCKPNQYSRNVKIGPISDSLKKIIVDFHNDKRNFIAGGNDVKYKPACRMATMQWDDDLAHLAKINIQKYDTTHDKCHRTNSFESAGQSLYQSLKTPAGDYDEVEMFKTAMQKWYNEVKNVKPSFIDSFPASYSGPPIGHYTVMMVDKNIRVGCSYGTYTKGQISYFSVTCNYASNNIRNNPIYKMCDKAGEHCTSGRNGNYINLCSDNEKYDVNK